MNNFSNTIFASNNLSNSLKALIVKVHVANAQNVAMSKVVSTYSGRKQDLNFLIVEAHKKGFLTFTAKSITLNYDAIAKAI